MDGFYPVEICSITHDMGGERWSFLLLFLTSAYCNGQIYKFSQNDSLSFEGRKLNNHVFSEFSTKHLVTQCAMECFLQKRCLSFNFAKESRVCQLNDATHNDFPSDFNDDETGYNYHLKDAFHIDPVSTYSNTATNNSIHHFLVSLSVCSFRTLSSNARIIVYNGLIH